MNCEYCQSPAHIWFQCPKKPDGWKPARLAKVRIGTASSPDRLQTPKSDVSASPPSDMKVHTQSTAARKDVRGEPLTASGGLVCTRDPTNEIAGTQALPVDTNSLQTQKASSGNADGGKPLTQTRPANPLKPNPDWYAGIDALPGHEPPPQNPKFDKKAWMKAYMKIYMRKRRAKQKEGTER